ncbi:MAG: IS4 family transposase, partial [Lachnospiraceae bacterium]|nr:IS4 family transposase [Lachnospiraceae bacterium]
MADAKRMLDDLTDILNASKTASTARTTKRGFTQARKISLLDVLLFYTFRSAETTNKDIISYFSKTDMPKVSKQGMFKALNKTNPDVFPLIIRELAEKFYSHGDYETVDGYLVLACDGTKMDLPPTQELKEKFGGNLNKSIQTYDQVKKPPANCSVLLDVLNRIILDAAVEPCRTSEIPMLFHHLENCEALLRGKKVILLCDRYYGPAELFLYCMQHGYHFIVRNKSYAYKDYVSLIERDGWMDVPFNKAWYKRMKRDDCRDYAQRLSSLHTRVVKNHYEYTMTGRKRASEPVTIDSVYLTNLDSMNFSAEKIVSMYHTMRWDNETAYFDIKNHLEAERFNSGKKNIVVCELYGKILCYSICGALYKAGDERLVAGRSADGMTTAYDYIPDME